LGPRRGSGTARFQSHASPSGIRNGQSGTEIGFFYKRDQLVNRKKRPFFYRKQITHQQNGDQTYEGWNFNSGNYLFTTDTK